MAVQLLPFFAGIVMPFSTVARLTLREAAPNEPHDHHVGVLADIPSVTRAASSGPRGRPRPGAR